MKTLFSSVLCSSACIPSSLPTPDCLYPPNGVCGNTLEFEFTPSTPVRIARATRSWRAPSRVQSDPERPYGVSLAMRIASASSRNGIR